MDPKARGSVAYDPCPCVNILLQGDFLLPSLPSYFFLLGPTRSSAAPALAFMCPEDDDPPSASHHSAQQLLQPWV